MADRKEGAAGDGICSKCKSRAVMRQAYSGESLCKKHFMRMFEDRVRKSIREFSMLKPNQHVAVALSGGKDSAVLLHLLCDLKQRLPMRISAILVDEGISGYRPHTIKTAKKECEKLGVKLHIVTFEKEFGKKLDAVIKKRDGKKSEGRCASGAKRGACTYCGVFRRALLNRAARRIGADKLAVGHNLDDTAQTVLMNLMRNEPARLARFGISGGVADGEGLVPRIKPLVRTPEKEVAIYAMLKGIGIHFMQCPYAEEALRQDVRSVLNKLEEKYPGTKFRMLNSFVAMRPALMKFASDEAKESSGKIGACRTCGDATSGTECAACRLEKEI